MTTPEVDSVEFWATLHRVDSWAYNRPGTYGTRVWRSRGSLPQAGTVLSWVALDNGTLDADGVYLVTHTFQAAVVRAPDGRNVLILPGSLQREGVARWL